MPDDTKLDELMALMLAELKSLNRSVRLLASHLMVMAEALPRPAVDGIMPPISDELPQALPEPLVNRLRAMEPERREHLLGALQAALTGH